MPAFFFLGPQPVNTDPDQTAIHSAATITASGSQVITGVGGKEVSLFVNVKSAPTGTTPVITFTIAEVDPGDNTTVLGQSKSGIAISAVTTQRITLESTFSGTLLVSWAVTGSSPSFTNVYTTLVSKTETERFDALVGSSGTVFGELTTVLATVVPLLTSDFAETAAAGVASATLVSTSASDASAGTGVRTVKITWIDINGNRNTSNGTMNGTTGVTVNFSPNMFAVELIEALTTGTGGIAAGKITIGTQNAILTGESVSKNAVHYAVPGKTTLIRKMRLSVSAAGSSVQLKTNNSAGTGVIARGIGPRLHLGVMAQEFSFDPPLIIQNTSAKPLRVYFELTPDGTTSTVTSVGFDWLEL